MPVLEIAGWIGSGLIVVSMMQQRILRLRAINLAGSVVHVFYNGILGVWPVAGLNVVLSVIQVVNLTRLLRTRHSEADYTVVAIGPAEPYLRHLMREQAADVARYVPGFAPDDVARGSDLAYLVLRGTETVGYVLLRDAGGGVAEVRLDYVTEKYRDLTPGEFVFRRSGVLEEAGFRKVVTPAGMRQPYYPRIGFARVGDRYELALSS